MKAKEDVPNTDERQERATTIAFESEDLEHQRPTRGRRWDNVSIHSHGRKRSRDRDSILSSRSRRRASQHDLAIGYRTLSFQASESKARSRHEAEDLGGAKGKATAAADDWARADDHTVTIEKLCQRHRTSLQVGLSKDAAVKRIEEYGYNVLPRQKSNHLRKILGYVFGGFCSVLWVGVLIFFLCWRPLGDPNPQAYNLGLAILVIIVILLQASFSAFQDWSTARTMNSILDMVPSDATVLRDGVYIVVSTRDLVPGDIVQISIGDKVPADLRLIETSGDARLERSAMTGESEEVEASVEPTHENILESLNMAWMGTVVTNGSASGLVVFTGHHTVMGAIAKATSRVKEKPTAIQQEVSRFVRIIIGLTLCLVCLILFSWVGWLRLDHSSFLSVVGMLNNVMGCVVAFIPEGMPIGVALTLMIIARRMKAVNVLPKSLATVETLGCVQVICSDKTGTLTKNQMSVVSVGFADHYMHSDQVARCFAEKKATRALTKQCEAARLCNAATFDDAANDIPISEREAQGNPTDCALLRYAEEKISWAALCKNFPQIAQIAFNSKNKFMLTVHERPSKAQNGPSSPEKQPCLVFVKGAPDVLLPKCNRYWSYESDEVRQLDDETRAAFTARQIKMSSNAERVILLCEREYSPVHAIGSNEFAQELIDHCASDMTAIGMLGIFDPPRPETASTVAQCRRAGVRFFMMTGDFGLTGIAIAKKVGIFTGEHEPDDFLTIENRRKSTQDIEFSNHSLVLQGEQISRLERCDWDLVCQYEEIVFGRCSPEHKLTIITELKKRGLSTAVTGDGVNDAPALKAADVGIAMVNGSDVALEAAHLVLLDQFSSIVDGIRLGRLVFQNLQKVISYLLPAGSWSEIWPVLMNVFFGVPLPLSSFLMIIICVFTDLFLSLSLIMEKEEFDLLSLPPRNRKKEHLINLKIYAQSYLFIGVMETICAHAMFFLYYWRAAKIPIRDLFFLYEKYTDGFHGYTQEQLTTFNTKGQAVYFVTLVLLQWGNILSIRNKRLSILQADPIRKTRRNPWLLASAAVSLAIAIFVTEQPGIQSLFGTASVPLEFWLIPMPLALGILLIDEMRKLCVRVWPKGPVARIAW